MWGAAAASLRRSALACSAIPLGTATAFAYGGAPRRQATRCDGLPSLSVGCYNVLCSTYAVKWKEREGMAPDGSSNWRRRWPVMQDIIKRAQLDVLALQEVEQADLADVVSGLGDEYQAHYFKHAKRPPDGVLIAVRKAACDGRTMAAQLQWRGSVAFGRVDFVHKESGCLVRVVTAHMRGGNEAQLSALRDFAEAYLTTTHVPDITIITGDFNEDFTDKVTGAHCCPWPKSSEGEWLTVERSDGEPDVSRPAHKQGPGQSSGKGKIDWIFVRGRKGGHPVEPFRDAASRLAIQESHAPCLATGEWPSDHGCEALSLRVLPKAVPWSSANRRAGGA